MERYNVIREVRFDGPGTAKFRRGGEKKDGRMEYRKSSHHKTGTREKLHRTVRTPLGRRR